MGEGAAAPEPAATWSRGARVRVPANVRSRPGPRGRGRSSAQGGPGRWEGVRSGPGRGSERRRGSGAGPRGAGPDCLGDEQRRPPPRCGADPGLDPLRGHSGEAQRPRPAGKAEPQGEPQHRRWGTETSPRAGMTLAEAAGRTRANPAFAPHHPPLPRCLFPLPLPVTRSIPPHCQAHSQCQGSITEDNTKIPDCRGSWSPLPHISGLQGRPSA